MDESHALINFFDNSEELTVSASPNVNDDNFLYFFSSPTTQAEDSSLQRPFANQSIPPQPQFLSNSHPPDPVASFDSLIAPNPQSHQHHVSTLPSNVLHHPNTPHVPHLPNHPSISTHIKPEPHLAPTPALATSSSSHSSCGQPANDDPFKRGFSRLGGKSRSLKAMRAIAKRNAPKVSLSDEELMEISQMYESEQSLEQSRELYNAIVHFKRCMAKHGYKLKSLYVDSIPEGEPTDIDTTPCAFVLNQNPKPPPPPPSSEKSDQSDIPVPSQPQEPQESQEPHESQQPNAQAQISQKQEVGIHSSVTLTTCDSATRPASSPKRPAEASVERPRKRARTVEKMDSLNSARVRFNCAVCCKKMSDVNNLIRHFRHGHQGKKPFMCPKCKGFYSSEGTLWHHLNNVHSESRRIHKCEYCDASYDSSGAKTRHVHGTHHTERPLYACTYPGCGRSFIFPAHLESHATAEHEGFRPFKCDECNKTFSSANGLVRHSREVHRKEKAYTCPVCQTGLTKRCHLKRHLLNVHHLPIEIVDVEMKRHPNPGDIPVLKMVSSPKE